MDQYRGWLRAGHWVLYAVGPDNDIQSWMWFTVAKDGSQIAPFDFRIGMKVPPGIAFLWDAYTVPAYRRRGLYETLLVQSVEECFQQGARQVWGHAQITNPSRRVILTTDLAGETAIQANSYRTVLPDIPARLSSRDIGARRAGDGRTPTHRCEGGATRFMSPSSWEFLEGPLRRGPARAASPDLTTSCRKTLHSMLERDFLHYQLVDVAAFLCLAQELRNPLPNHARRPTRGAS